MKKSRAPRGSFAPADAIALVAAALAAFFLLVVMVRQAHAHDWFSRKVDPVFGWRCCGGNDCKVIRPNGRNITAEKDGYRIRLSLEEARAINPVAELPVDGLVTWDRVQPSETNEFAICLMPYNRSPRAGGVFCFFEPPAI